MNEQRGVPEYARVPAYEPPEVVTYTDEEILEEMGPAQAVTGLVDP
jgi:hypothetical protein